MFSSKSSTGPVAIGLACALHSYGYTVINTQGIHRAWQISMTAQSLSDRTIDERLRVVRQFEEQVNCDALWGTSDQITMWLASLPSATTRHTYFVTLRAWFRWLIMSEQRSDDPTLRVPSPKRPRYEPRPLLDSQIQAVLTSDMRAATRSRILLGAFAGLRVHEIAKIKGQELDRVTGLLTVTGKGRRIDRIPLHPVLLKDAERYPKRGYWFPTFTNESNHVGSEAIRRTIIDAFSRVGVTMTPHQLRHYFATALLASDVDSRIVQKLMRHANLSTTALYMGVTMTQQQNALKQLDLPQAFSNIHF